MWALVLGRFSNRLIALCLGIELAFALVACGGITGGGSGGDSDAFQDSFVWTHPSDLADTISGFGNSLIGAPIPLMNATGQGMIAWLQNANGKDRVYASLRKNGTWTHPSSGQNAVSFAATDQNFLSADMSPSGNRMLAWSEKIDGLYAVFVSQYDMNVWTTPIRLSPPGVSAVSTSVAINDNNDAVVSWLQGGKVLFAQRTDGLWSVPETEDDGIDPLGGVPVTPCRIAIGESGDVILVWRHVDRLFLSERRSGIWTHPTTVTDSINPANDSPSEQIVRMATDGTAFLMWSELVVVEPDDPDLKTKQLFYSSYDGLIWDHPEDSGDNRIGFLNGSVNYSMDMNSMGESLLVYSEKAIFPSVGAGVYFASGNSADLDLPGSATDSIGDVDFQNALGAAAVSTTGDKLAVWLQTDPSLDDDDDDDKIRFALQVGESLDTSGTVPVIGGPNPNISKVTATMGGSGEAIILWTQYDGSNFRIYMSERDN